MGKAAMKNQPIHKRFEEVVESYPEKCAIRFENKSLSYSELNKYSNNLAKHLESKGVLRGSVVGINMDRSCELIVAMLAVIKLGAAYLPIASNNPLNRNLFILNQAKVNHIITDKNCEDLNENKRVVIWASEAVLNEDHATYLPSEGLTTVEDKCYVMYTSGTTGDPKGVIVPHRAVMRLVVNTNYINITPEDTVLQFAPIAFDASTFEIWGALLNGSTLILYPGDSLNINAFSRILNENHVSILWLTAALFHLIATNAPKTFSTIKTLLAGGDVLNYKCINKVFDHSPEITIINGYGPTENTTFTCCHRMVDTTRPEGSVPIGVSVFGTSLHVLNSELDAVAPGEVGELYVSGSGVALGYVNDEVSSVFFRNESIAPGLIYKTGDLVFENIEGNLEYVGRQDNQIKIRGYRVSLEEIQQNIINLSCVSDAVVVAKKFDDEEMLLICNLELEQNAKATVAEIKRNLLDSMPDYMIPGVIRIGGLEVVNRNGKVDKRKLLEN